MSSKNNALSVLAGVASMKSASNQSSTKDILRKVSHSVIERRRRERINDKLLQLKQLVPSCASCNNLHKLAVLEETIAYIHQLHSMLQNNSCVSEKSPASPESMVSELESLHSQQSVKETMNVKNLLCL